MSRMQVLYATQNVVRLLDCWAWLNAEHSCCSGADSMWPLSAEILRAPLSKMQGSVFRKWQVACSVEAGRGDWIWIACMHVPAN